MLVNKVDNFTSAENTRISMKKTSLIAAAAALAFSGVAIAASPSPAGKGMGVKPVGNNAEAVLYSHRSRAVQPSEPCCTAIKAVLYSH